MGRAARKGINPFTHKAGKKAVPSTHRTGIGAVSLPGMMKGQILSGTLPTTAILYQIAVTIAICTTVCLSTFGSLFFGYRTLYNKRGQVELGVKA